MTLISLKILLNITLPHL